MTYAQIIAAPASADARVAYATDNELVYFIPAGVPGSGAKALSTETLGVIAALAVNPLGARVALGLDDGSGNLLINGLALGDSSTATLDAGVFSGDALGNAVVHDGLFPGGKVLANDHLRFRGGGMVETADLNVNLFSKTVLGTIILPSALVVAGTRLLLSGKFNGYFSATDIVDFSIIIVPSNDWTEASSLENPLGHGNYGFGMTSYGKKACFFDFQYQSELVVGVPPQLIVESSATQLGVVGTTIVGSGDEVGDGVVGASLVALVDFGVTGLSTCTVDPGSAETLRLCLLVGDGSNATISTFFYNYDLKLDILP